MSEILNQATHNYIIVQTDNTEYAFLHTEPGLKELLNDLHPVRASWYNIGLELGIPYTTLDCFRQNHSDQSDLLREMLKHWLDAAIHPHPCWAAVVKALRSPIVHKQYIAEQLESKYCAPVQHTREKANSPTKKVERSEGTLACSSLASKQV